MLHKWGNIQVVNINNDKALCLNCGANILNIANFSYDRKTISEPTYREELCKCKSCNTQFILHYDFFDPEGHIYSRIFTEDINNPDYNWGDELTEEQKSAILKHLKECSFCYDRLSQELLTDAWFKSYIQELRQKNNPKKVV